MYRYTVISLACMTVAFAQGPKRPLSARNAKPLPDAPVAELAPLAADAAPPQPKHQGVRAVGLGRTIPPRFLERGEWTTLADGQSVWRVSLRSPRAWGMRVHFRKFQVGDGQVWLYPKGTAVSEGRYVGPYKAGGPFQDGEFWSEAVPGEEIVLEFAPAGPPAEPNSRPPFAVDQISHLVSEPLAPAKPAALSPVADGPADVASAQLGTVTSNTAQVQNTCSPDVACFAQWSTQASAVASILFTTAGASYLCSGSLIADAGNSGQPYFTTANHCVGDSATARTVVAHFQYQAATCNGVAPDYFSVPKVSGAQYLASAPIAQGDFSLLLLSAAPPPGSAFLPWAGGAEPATGAAVVAIHHPGHVLDGSAPNSKRISFGTRDRAQVANIEGELMPADKNLFVRFDPGQGYTEPGSSGSPLISQSGQIVGTLTGGAEGTLLSPCNPSFANAVYGKFAAALSTLGPILGCSYELSSPVTQFSSAAGSGSITVASAAKCGWQLVSGSAWLHWAGAFAGTGPGSAGFTLDANSSTVARTAAISIGSTRLLLTQSGTAGASAVPPSSVCAGPLPPQAVTLPGIGGPRSLLLPQPGACSWPLVSHAAWLGLSANTVPAGGTETLTAQVNSSYLARATTVTSGTLAMQVIQSPYYATTVFSDVPVEDPLSDYANLIKSKGITSGCSTVQYCPGDATTRGQMAVFVIRGVLGTDQFDSRSIPYFDDVPVSHPFFRYIQKMKELGITAGCSATPALYCPEAQVTRSQMGVFLIRSKYGNNFSYTQTPYFLDVGSGATEFPFVQKMRDLGITSGCSATQYCGTASTTRGQMAMFLVRAFLSGL